MKEKVDEAVRLTRKAQKDMASSFSHASDASYGDNPSNLKAITALSQAVNVAVALGALAAIEYMGSDGEHGDGVLYELKIANYMVTAVSLLSDCTTCDTFAEYEKRFVREYESVRSLNGLMSLLSLLRDFGDLSDEEFTERSHQAAVDLGLDRGGGAPKRKDDGEQVPDAYIDALLNAKEGGNDDSRG